MGSKLKTLGGPIWNLRVDQKVCRKLFLFPILAEETADDRKSRKEKKWWAEKRWSHTELCSGLQGNHSPEIPRCSRLRLPRSVRSSKRIATWLPIPTSHAYSKKRVRRLNSSPPWSFRPNSTNAADTVRITPLLCAPSVCWNVWLETDLSKLTCLRGESKSGTRGSDFGASDRGDASEKICMS